MSPANIFLEKCFKESSENVKFMREVTLTRYMYLLPTYVDSNNACKKIHVSSNCRKSCVTKNNLRIISKLSDHDQNTCEVSKESA